MQPVLACSIAMAFYSRAKLPPLNLASDGKAQPGRHLEEVSRLLHSIHENEGAMIMVENRVTLTWPVVQHLDSGVAQKERATRLY